MEEFDPLHLLKSNIGGDSISNICDGRGGSKPLQQTAPDGASGGDVNLNLTMDLGDAAKPRQHSGAQQLGPEANTKPRPSLEEMLMMYMELSKGTYLRLGALEENVSVLSARGLLADGYLLQLLHASQRNMAGQERVNVLPLHDIQGQNPVQGSPSVHMQAGGDGGTSVHQNFVAQGGVENGALFTHHRAAQDKGKGIAGTGEGASPGLEMLTPYSPDTDGGHYLDRSQTSVPNVFGLPNMDPRVMMDPEWAFGLPKANAETPSKNSQTHAPLADKDVFELSSWAQLESTTQFCGLYKSTDCDEGPSKFPRLEGVEIITMPAGGGGLVAQRPGMPQSGALRVTRRQPRQLAPRQGRARHRR